MDKHRAWALAYAAIIVVTIVRVAATHRVFCEVLDEPVHVAAGMQWLTRGTMSLDPSHPPLERILSAIPLRLAGAGFPTEPDAIQNGNRILYSRGEHVRNLVLARIGNLLLLLLMIGSTAAWARRYFAEPIPLLGAALLACMPPILGHAGVATTDVAIAATLPLSLYALDRWLETPGRGRAAFLGFAIGIGLLSKFSFLLFFPLAAVVVLVLRRRLPPVRSIAIALLIAFLVTWAGYRFSFGRVGDIHDSAGLLAELAPGPLKPAATWIAERIPIPAPEFFIGAGMVKLHDRGGHTSYLLGKYSDTGWWYYFPVVLFYKTPIPFLILATLGIGMLLIRARRERTWGELQFVLVPLVILLAAMTSKINIGIRHILPVYSGLTVVAGFATVTLWRRSREAFSRAALAALLLWLVLGTARAHPDYLAWFNEAAGEHPEAIVVDSNLDWGQDVFRLRRAVQELHITSL
ncbi:MAG: glycosyltransferase family 39 protein, partial [Thermoanaerobaculia bacterium]